MRMKIDQVLVIGAGGALGHEIVRGLRTRDIDVTATYRTPRKDIEEKLTALGARPIRLDINDTDTLAPLIARAKAAIFTPILTISKIAAPFLEPNQSAVFFSSNNAAIDKQAEIYAQLRAAEETVRQDASRASILRPTMIYGYPGDGNLAQLIRAMRRWPMIPMPGNGAALQQPVFYKDLAAIAVETLLDETAHGRVSPAAGPKPMSQRELYEIAAKAAGARLRTFGLPLGPGAKALVMLERSGLRLPISSTQLQRAAMDKTPQGPSPILGKTSLEEGLSQLAAGLDEALDESRLGA